MPHIKSIRLVNVHYNNATQFYDDFMLEPRGMNTTYDLENGGGKSLLLLMILQTVLPKTNLRREKPISLLFQGGKDRTSHVAVEWLLEEGGGYKYLLTGFSARRRRGASDSSGKEATDDETNLQAADIEHLNWCVFYNDNKVTGIKAAPLVTGESGRKGYATFDDIRKYIQQMRQKGLPAEVFDKIEQYQRFIAAHSLIAAEWNIIRGINSGENSIESYFRQNATSRKLIENLFVKIVEDMEALNKGEQSPDESSLLADTLIDIRSKLTEYLTRKAHMAEYEKIKEYYVEFGRKNDELLQDFQNYEAYKRQAAAIRALIGNKQDLLQQAKTAAAAKQEHNGKGRTEEKELRKLLEAGQVNYRKQQWEKTAAHLQEDHNLIVDKQTELEKQLNELLTLEGYGEYRADKEQLQAIEKRLLTLSADRDSSQIEYQAAGGRLRFLTERLFAELARKYAEILTAKDELTNEQKIARQALIEAEKQAAVLANEVNILLQGETVLMDKQKELNSFFLQRGETDALLFADQVLKDTEEELQEHLRANDEVGRNMEVCESQIRSLEQTASRQDSEIDQLLFVQDQDEQWLRDYRHELSVLEQQAGQFGKGTVAEYQQSLEVMLTKERLKKLEKEVEAGRLQQKKELSAARGYYVPNEEILALAEKLSAKCEFVQPGIDWLAQAAAEEKEQLLRRMPFFPFAVLVDRQSFEKVKTGRIKLEFACDYPVPVVNVETVRLTESQLTDNMYYICSFADLVLHHERYEQYIRSMEDMQAAAGSQIAAIAETIHTFDAALAEITHFSIRYPLQQVDERQHAVASRGKQIAELRTRQRQIAAECSRLAKQKQDSRDRVQQLTMLIATGREKIDKLTGSILAGKELADVRERLRGKQRELESVNSKKASNHELSDKIDERFRLLGEQSEQLAVEKSGLKKELDQLTSFGTVETDFSVIQAKAEFKALSEAVSGRMVEETDLRNQLNKLENSLDATKTRIKRDYDVNLAVVEESDKAESPVIIPTQIQIETARQVKADNARQLRSTGEKLQALYSELRKLEGKLEEIIKDFPASVIAELPGYDSEARYREEIEIAQQLISTYEQAIVQANEEVENLSRQLDRLANQAESYDAFIERERAAGEGAIAGEIQDFRTFESEYRKLQGAVQSQCGKWDNRIRTIREETAGFVMREALEELAKIGQPGSAAECGRRQQSFAEYIANIEEQMRKINRDIVQLESYQEDFTRRCIQRAALVLGHLRKLEILSRIEVYGRRINMIELKLPEFEEKEKALRMKSHINAIVREIGDDGVADRKIIIAKLSVKELLAQITDMDKAIVRLYKIESIPENSRSYRWEQAIGSEGQNNSLYFIFAACLISFIRMLSISNSSVKTKKVIIADNPFGATSAVYLWDPMFTILKQNDVQLIAPGHRIPREITSRFGVTYLLNQDILEDGRRRVVVKDIRVEEDEELRRYVDPEQLAMF